MLTDFRILPHATRPGIRTMQFSGFRSVNVLRTNVKHHENTSHCFENVLFFIDRKIKIDFLTFRTTVGFSKKKKYIRSFFLTPSIPLCLVICEPARSFRVMRQRRFSEIHRETTCAFYNIHRPMTLRVFGFPHPRLVSFVRV